MHNATVWSSLISLCCSEASCSGTTKKHKQEAARHFSITCCALSIAFCDLRRDMLCIDSMGLSYHWPSIIVREHGSAGPMDPLGACRASSQYRGPHQQAPGSRWECVAARCDMSEMLFIKTDQCYRGWEGCCELPSLSSSESATEICRSESMLLCHIPCQELSRASSCPYVCSRIGTCLKLRVLSLATCKLTVEDIKQLVAPRGPDVLCM